MNEQRVGRELQRAGYPVHEHDGVWWHAYAFGFYKPLDAVASMEAGSCRPALWRSPVGFSHVVPHDKDANSTWEVMELGPEQLSTYDLKVLKPRKRTYVRKFSKVLRFSRIVDIDASYEEITDICVSTAERTGYGRRADWYRSHEQEWRRQLRREFGLAGREWWGVHLDDRMIAYLYGYAIEETMHIGVSKSLREYQKHKPNEFMIFRFTELCRDLPDVRRVIYGGWSAETEHLNHFKESMGFERKCYPVWRTVRVNEAWLKRGWHLFERLRGRQ